MLEVVIRVETELSHVADSESHYEVVNQEVEEIPEPPHPTRKPRR